MGWKKIPREEALIAFMLGVPVKYGTGDTPDFDVGHGGPRQPWVAWLRGECPNGWVRVDIYNLFVEE